MLYMVYWYVVIIDIRRRRHFGEKININTRIKQK